MIMEMNGSKIGPGREFIEADLSEAELQGAELSGANLTGANLTRVVGLE